MTPEQLQLRCVICGHIFSLHVSEQIVIVVGDNEQEDAGSPLSDGPAAAAADADAHAAAAGAAPIAAVAVAGSVAGSAAAAAAAACGIRLRSLHIPFLDDDTNEAMHEFREQLREARAANDAVKFKDVLTEALDHHAQDMNPLIVFELYADTAELLLAVVNGGDERLRATAMGFAELAIQSAEAAEQSLGDVEKHIAFCKIYRILGELAADPQIRVRHFLRAYFCCHDVSDRDQIELLMLNVYGHIEALPDWNFCEPPGLGEPADAFGRPDHRRRSPPPRRSSRTRNAGTASTRRSNRFIDDAAMDDGDAGGEDDEDDEDVEEMEDGRLFINDDEEEVEDEDEEEMEEEKKKSRQPKSRASNGRQPPARGKTKGASSAGAAAAQARPASRNRGSARAAIADAEERKEDEEEYDEEEYALHSRKRRRKGKGK